MRGRALRNSGGRKHKRVQGVRDRPQKHDSRDTGGEGGNEVGGCGEDAYTCAIEGNHVRVILASVYRSGGPG